MNEEALRERQAHAQQIQEFVDDLIFNASDLQTLEQVTSSAPLALNVSRRMKEMGVSPPSKVAAAAAEYPQSIAERWPVWLTSAVIALPALVSGVMVAALLS